MGNCIRKQTCKRRREETAGVFRDTSRRDSRGTGPEKSTLLREEKAGGADRVTVKVSKNQLRQLLKQAEAEGLSSEDVLFRLMNAGDDQFEANQRPWSPSLRSIPE